jgi:hypothetical protein
MLLHFSMGDLDRVIAHLTALSLTDTQPWTLFHAAVSMVHCEFSVANTKTKQYQPKSIISS